MVGLSIGLFARRNRTSQITDIATSKVKLGFSGKVGNKGATLIRFLFQDTSFCFLNCHLASGTLPMDMKKRSQQVGEIFSNAFVKERGTSTITALNHQVKVILGDLNFRISMENSKVRHLV